MAASVPWACCAVLAAAAAAVYTQKHSPQEAPHVQYERLGSDVMLPCGTASWEAAVTWRVNGTDLAPDLLNGSQLVLRSLELGHSGLYACFHRDSWHLRHQVLLHVGCLQVTRVDENGDGTKGSDRAQIMVTESWWVIWSDSDSGSEEKYVGGEDNSRKEAVEGAGDTPVLTCRSNTYPKGFYCSWHLPTPTYIPNTFNVTVLHGSKIMVCEKHPPLKTPCHIRYMHLFSTIKYKVSISVSNALGHNTTAITFDEFTIVKPDPPENVVARPVPSNPRRLEVTWQTPSTWPDPESFPLKFFLRYRPLILDQWQHVELSDGTAHTITDAYAGKEYIIQVAAKDNEIGTWSDWSVAAHATPWTEEPRHLTTEAQAPETTTSTTSSLAPPPTTKICDPGELGSGGGPSIPFLNSVPVILALAAAAATANNLLICQASYEDMPEHLQRRPELSLQTPASILHTGRRTFCILFRHNL
ncbi:ciliary neurotrophic factor receptor subunit alpha isoform X1 [Cricetulus griseus]|uniref:ciliary neurotrophic factor receptor subunit alpha isoform X1 n=1 Tax=Cricetulus griseus TaxID=10029 RepID=UPI00022F4F7C|nr:ciliary neurotrophic factor receptor subunit alpha isoform X1 [Cricetulus griseus]